MTKWKTFGDSPIDRPGDGEFVLLCHELANGKKDYIQRHYNDNCDLKILYWMSIPQTPDLEPKSKVLVPKDGDTYLCWICGDGVDMVYWCDYEEQYTSAIHNTCIKSYNILGYMGQNGKWVGSQ